MQEKQQQASEYERLRQLRENAENQETKLRRVRALKGQVEQKRLSNSKLGQCQGESEESRHSMKRGLGKELSRAFWVTCFFPTRHI